MKNNLVSQTWKRLTASVDVARFETGQSEFEVALHKICAGGKTPKHDHQGLEYTVVLKGSFSDENAVYREGDFLVREPGDVHQPMGAQNGECICLSALSAPIKLTNPFGFLMKPWLTHQPYVSCVLTLRRLRTNLCELRIIRQKLSRLFEPLPLTPAERSLISSNPNCRLAILSSSVFRYTAHSLICT